MSFIDAHTHTFLRGPEDLAAMADSGVHAAVVCAFLPVAPSGASSLLDLFTWLDTVERARLDRAGIAARLAVGIHPRSMPPEAEVEPVLARVRALVESGRAVAIGEIGLETGSDKEKATLARQLRLARELGVPAIVHTPRANKKERVAETLRLIDEAGIAAEQIILDHMTPELIAALDESRRGFWMGLTLQPGKTTPADVASLLRARGPERILLDSDLSHMPSDPRAVAGAARWLLQSGFSRESIALVAEGNAARAMPK